MSGVVGDLVTNVALGAACWIVVACGAVGGWLFLIRRSPSGGPMVPAGGTLPALSGGSVAAQDATMTRTASPRSARSTRSARTVRGPRRHRSGQFVDPYSPLLLEDVAFTRRELLQARTGTEGH